MGSKAFNVHGSNLATIGFQAIKWTNAISWINFMNVLYPIYLQIWLNYHPMDVITSTPSQNWEKKIN
jgi:hypothetical protein